MTAKSDDVIKDRNRQLLRQLGFLAVDSHPCFNHDPNRSGVGSMPFDSGGICLDNVTTQHKRDVVPLLSEYARIFFH